MSVPPAVGPSRRSMLRAVLLAAPVLAAAPAITGIAGLADPAVAAVAVAGPRRLRVPVRGRKPGRCRGTKVRVKGRCKPGGKAGAKPPVVPTTVPVDPAVAPAPVTAPTAPPSGGGPTGPTAPPAYTGAFTLLSAPDRHLVTRFSYGVDPTLAAAVTAAGGGAAWFEQQLTTPGVSDPATDQLLGWYPSLSRSPQDLWARQIGQVEQGWQVMTDYQRWVLLRRIASTRPVLDVMTEFFENHLHVPATGDTPFLFRADYGATIRRHALGRFEDLLFASITHPAMLTFLDGAVSTKMAPNENLGRELLELHTVGRGNHSESDVRSSARILTGHRVDMWRTWDASYRPGDHWVGRVEVLDFADANTAADGQGLTRRYLSYLARHPATAQRIARKLAVKFVSDDPPQALVDTLARTYLESGTAIVPVLRALVSSTAFAAAAGAKVRDPGEDVVATYRALQIRVQAPATPRRNDSGEAGLVWQSARIGLAPYGWPRPDGAPGDNRSWSSASRLIASLELHRNLCGGWWPSSGITYRAPVDWLPAPSVRFDVFVEHLAQTLLHQSTPPGLLQACCQAVDVTPATVITASHGVLRWHLAKVLTTILDSPHHLKR